ncbi:MAG: substrate-binding periplasmic protein [Kordiimonas sp.]
MIARIASIVGLGMFSMLVSAENVKPLTLMAVKIPGLYDTDNPGPYNAVFERLMVGSSYNYVLREAPLRRATTAFIKGNADCYFFGTNDKSIYQEQGVPKRDLLISDPVNPISLKIYTRAGETVINEASELQGLFIAVDQGATEISRAAEHLSVSPEYLLPAQTLSQAFRLLNQKRVDAVMAFDSDVRIYQGNSSDASHYGVSDTLSLIVSHDSVVCRRSDVTEQFISHINEQLSSLKKSGDLDRILNGPN